MSNALGRFGSRVLFVLSAALLILLSPVLQTTVTANTYEGNEATAVYLVPFNAPNPPQFSTPGGFFDAEFDLTISSDAGTTVRFTTDGSVPTINSPQFTDAIRIHSPAPTVANSPMSAQAIGRAYEGFWHDHYIPNLYYNGMVVRARAFDAAGQGSSTVTHSYFVQRDGRGVFDTRVLSIAIEPYHFADPIQGIYRNWDNTQWAGQPDIDNDDGPRHISYVAMFYPNGELMFSDFANTWVFGNWSRRHPRRSLRMNFNQATAVGGGGDLRGMYNLFPQTRRHFYAPDEYIGRFRHINARTADRNRTGLRESVVHFMAEPLRPTIQNSTYGAVFVNGEFWGMYDLRSHRNTALISQLYGVSNVELIDSAWDLHSLIASVNMTDPGAFAYLDTHIDMDNMIDYFILGYHFDNWDWISNNFELWRTTQYFPGVHGGDMRWRFIVQDFDEAINHQTNNMMNFFTTNGYAGSTLPWNFGAQHPRGQWAASILQNLFQNEEFRNTFAARYSTYTGTVFHPSRANVILDQMVEERVQTIGRDLYRWSYHGAWSPTSAVDSWLNDWGRGVQNIRDILNNRDRYAIEHIRGYYNRTDRANLSLGLPAGFTNINWQLDSSRGFFDISGAQIRHNLFRNMRNNTADGYAFTAGNFSANYIRNLPITVTAMPNAGYNFSHFTVTGGGSGIDGTFTQNPMILTPTAATTNITVNAVFTRPGVIINQFYGQGTPGENSVSHGFIELYNMTEYPISLNGYTLQVQNLGDNTPNNLVPEPWEVLSLDGRTIAPRSSLLIVSTAWYNDGLGGDNVPEGARHHIPRYVIERYDIGWNIEFSNRNITVALVNNMAPLSDIIATNEFVYIVDMVGAINSLPPRDRVDNYFGSAPAYRISRQLSVRRDNFLNTRDNFDDFSSIDFRYPSGYADARPGVATSGVGLTNARLAILRPRSSHDGEWGRPAVPSPITIINGGTGASASPNPAGEGQIVNLNAGTPPAGHRFLYWTTDTPYVSIQNASSPTGAYFVMVDGPVTVTANFFEPVLRSPSIIINQVHGQGSIGTNAISHGFIELYNPTDQPIWMGNYSIQAVNGVGVGPWNVLPLSGRVIEPRSSFLIVSNAWYNVNEETTGGHMPRYIIRNYDMSWNLQFDNNRLVVALVANQAPMTGIITPSEWNNVIDLVGVLNDPRTPSNYVAHYLGADNAMRISRQLSVRRDLFQNTRDNSVDFLPVDFRYPNGYANARPGPASSPAGISNARLVEVRPRWSGDGRWYGEFAPMITTTSIPAGMLDEDFSFMFTAIANPAHVVWTWFGQLPPGLNMSNDGRVFGVPTVPGTFAFTVHAENLYGATQQNFAITIEEPEWSLSMPWQMSSCPIIQGLPQNQPISSSLFAGTPLESSGAQFSTVVDYSGSLAIRVTDRNQNFNSIDIHFGAMNLPSGEYTLTIVGRVDSNTFVNLGQTDGPWGEIPGTFVMADPYFIITHTFSLPMEMRTDANEPRRGFRIALPENISYTLYDVILDKVRPYVPIDITGSFTCVHFLATVREVAGLPANAPVYTVNVSGITELDVSDRGITSLNGLEHFVSLEFLDASHNRLVGIDISSNHQLERLFIHHNYIDTRANWDAVVGWQYFLWNPGNSGDFDFWFWPQNELGAVNPYYYRLFGSRRNLNAVRAANVGDIVFDMQTLSAEAALAQFGGRNNRGQSFINSQAGQNIVFSTNFGSADGNHDSMHWGWIGLSVLPAGGVEDVSAGDILHITGRLGFEGLSASAGTMMLRSGDTDVEMISGIGGMLPQYFTLAFEIQPIHLVNPIDLLWNLFNWGNGNPLINYFAISIDDMVIVRGEYIPVFDCVEQGCCANCLNSCASPDCTCPMPRPTVSSIPNAPVHSVFALSQYQRVQNFDAGWLSLFWGESHIVRIMGGNIGTVVADCGTRTLLTRRRESDSDSVTLNRDSGYVTWDVGYNVVVKGSVVGDVPDNALVTVDGVSFVPVDPDGRFVINHTINNWSVNSLAIHTANAPHMNFFVYEIIITPPIRFGDVDGDGAVNMFDVFRLRQFLAGHPVTIDLAAADVNVDGVVDLADVFLLRRYLARHLVVLGPQPWEFATNEFAAFGDGLDVNSSWTVCDVWYMNFDEVHLTVSNVEAVAGGYVDVMVSMTQNPGVGLMQLLLHYDSSVLEPVGVTQGLPFTFTQPALTANPLPIVLEPRAFSNVLETGELVTVRFRVSEHASLGALPIAIEPTLVMDVDMRPVGIAIANGTVNIINVETAPDAPDADEEVVSEAEYLPYPEYPCTECTEYDEVEEHPGYTDAEYKSKEYEPYEIYYGDTN